jgi:hypothetical protein
MRPRVLALVLLSATALGLGACGSDTESTSDPAKKPPLTAPASANGLADTTPQQSSTSSADSESTQATTVPQQQAPATTTPSTAGGGTAAPGTTTTPQQGTGGGTAAPQAGTQNFESFCKQNPGAC